MTHLATTVLCEVSLSGHTIFAGNSEQAQDKWPEVGPSTCRGADHALSTVVWAPKAPPTCIPQWN